MSLRGRAARHLAAALPWDNRASGRQIGWNGGRRLGCDATLGLRSGFDVLVTR